MAKAFSPYRHERERYSIQSWLSSEGHLVGDFVNSEMLNVAHEAITQKLQDLNFKEGDIKFEIKKINIYEPSSKKPNLVLEAELSSGKHRTERRFKIELI